MIRYWHEATDPEVAEVLAGEQICDMLQLMGSAGWRAVEREIDAEISAHLKMLEHGGGNDDMLRGGLSALRKLRALPEAARAEAAKAQRQLQEQGV